MEEKGGKMIRVRNETNVAEVREEEEEKKKTKGRFAKREEGDNKY